MSDNGRRVPLRNVLLWALAAGIVDIVLIVILLVVVFG